MLYLQAGDIHPQAGDIHPQPEDTYLQAKDTYPQAKDCDSWPARQSWLPNHIHSAITGKMRYLRLATFLPVFIITL